MFDVGRRPAGPHADGRLPAAARAACYVDRDMWAKIVLNLLSNALKFTFDGRHHGAARARTPATPC